MTVPLLTVRDLRKAYGGRPVLEGIDLDVARGEVLGVVGPNGVGKSTAASIIAGQTPADWGTISLNGGPMDTSRVMLIDPEHTTDPNMTVAEVMFRHDDGAHSFVEQMYRVREVLSETGISLRPTVRLAELTPSERRMTEVVRMLADPRELIVIDELSTGLNAREIEELRYALNLTVKANRGVIYITHQLEEALKVCDRIAVIRNGKVSRLFTAAETTVEQLTQAMFGSAVRLTEAESHTTGDQILDVRGLASAGSSLSFQLNRGEILGFIGPRDSGVDDIKHTLLGRRPGSTQQLTVAGRPGRLDAPRDLPGLGIAVLTSMSDPEGDTHAARNMAMVDDEVDEGMVEDTASILLLLRKAESRISTLLNRPLSTGQRRWQQMQEFAKKNANVMVMVQPSDGLDVSAQKRFTSMMEDITDRGVGVVLFTSREDELHRFCDRIIHIEGGRIQAEWKKGQVSVEQLQQISHPQPQPLDQVAW
ncbi:MAG: ATP-binding cassette domain-containing protein [Arachnia propionica]|uniref:ATP-binding cassette domain-containing protein n=1 Tax=Arachnia propionica TaxID=1750 RepID=UPI0026F74FCE|nr:ATP-binding cassette domain-containing protein [Arachnia propionica]